ncbi:CubicO group peptidase, beta-lactamase class C family [Salinimicrobium sediminis]|uniref:CubicO group peptidase, beta-lactamase class C family n=1 Tax=Salinimicrobium sediminis TaxID=1343891 RepID=A0A285X4H3_9FLAO|nr:serine hydrolase domain-containing protein [Salinimicrobium sediminis]SOC79896.1 CubicO group peptidase, beta-lactamase class C family [Salinimicrobium sediminis]
MKPIYLLFVGFFVYNPALAFQSEIIDNKPGDPFNFERVEQVSDSLAHLLIKDNLITGMSIAIAEAGKVVLSKGYGLANVEHKVQATPETVYRVASITKQFTAAVILKLIEEGKMEISDTLGKYFPEYPAHGAGITIQQLLNQTSGIGSKKYNTEVEKIAAGRKAFYELSEEEIIEMFANAPLDFEPGEQFAYRNQNYILLGMIIEKVSGLPYGQYLEEKFLKPLGLEQTGYCDESRIIGSRAQGYISAKGEIFNAPYINMKNPGGAGGLCSTVLDLVRWNHLLYSGQVVSRESLDQMTASGILEDGRPTEYGFGLKLGKLGDHRKIYHGGSIQGFNSNLEFYPEEDLSIAVMTNTGSGQDEKISEALARAAFGLEIKNSELSAAERQKYEGSYMVKIPEKTIEIRFFSKDDQLQVDLAGQGISPLLFQGNSRFVAELDKNLVFTFLEEDQGFPELTVEMQGKTFSGTRKDLTSIEDN